MHPHSKGLFEEGEFCVRNQIALIIFNLNGITVKESLVYLTFALVQPNHNPKYLFHYSRAKGKKQRNWIKKERERARGG
jgi:hypothetical protein